ncbi:MAG TPA: FeoA family protein [Paucimonas sp.]|nr:FeoA family protein [Paucimonas sp.]
MSGNVHEAGSGAVKPHLGELKKGDAAIVVGLSDAHGPEHAATKMRLLELGFAPGEKVRIVAESFPRRDPIAVRVGNTTFALRRHEAALVHVMRADVMTA